MSSTLLQEVYGILREVRALEEKLSMVLEQERGEYDPFSSRKTFERIIVQCGRVGGRFGTYWGPPRCTVQHVLDETDTVFDEHFSVLSFNGDRSVTKDHIITVDGVLALIPKIT